MSIQRRWFEIETDAGTIFWIRYNESCTFDVYTEKSVEGGPGEKLYDFFILDKPIDANPMTQIINELRKRYEIS